MSGSRAEYGLLRPVMTRIKDSRRLDLQLVVTGLHLVPRYGRTVRFVAGDGFMIYRAVPMYPVRGESDPGLALARGVAGMSRAFRALRPDIVLLLGDRLEPLAAAIAAVAEAIPVAHLHGGDRSFVGHIDETIRHTITKLAHLHFPATKTSARRIVKLGEEPWRVRPVGTTALDGLEDEGRMRRAELCARYGFDLRRPFVLVVQHPVSSEWAAAGRQMRETLKAIAGLTAQAAISYPNNDPGSAAVIAEIERSVRLPFVRTFRSIPRGEYVALMRHAAAMVGNSSSGIIEAPALGLPMIHVGNRNVGREHAGNVVFIPHNARAVRARLRPILDREQSRIDRTGNIAGFSVRKPVKNPYGDGRA
ncbi:MAG: UDP-N-acetylglucosamine 2-epimerase, partial [Planctomycetota bacterium]|nr:UDP-N-acetylglucosamine 2-epimerase [Planctomycetota bacterium]